MTDLREVPMFPLGSVLFPQGVLPLHIFEIRYQRLLNHALENDRVFGVVLITRGSEVGGGEERAPIGTLARIEEHQRFDDGRAAVVSTGTTKFEVVKWLADEPFPRAVIRETPAEIVRAKDRELFAQARTSFENLIELGHRLGRLESVPESDWLDDIEEASWQLAGRAPCAAHDRYSILAAPTRVDRLIKIDELLIDVYTDLELMGPVS